MDNLFLALFIFILCSTLTIILIFKKPNLQIRIKNRNLSIETFFIGPLIGVVLILIFNILTIQEIFHGLVGQNNFSPIGILILFLSMVFISTFLDTTGFFEFCARLALKFAGKSGIRLFFIFYVIISTLTIFTSNDIIILTFTPFIYYYTKAAKVDPKPYLIAEFFAANTWSMALYIGNPTNILLASAFSIKFDEYFVMMLLPTVGAGIINFLLLLLIFRKQIHRSIIYNASLTLTRSIEDKSGAILGVTILSLCIFLLAIAPYFSIQMWIVSFYCALFLLIIVSIRDLYHRFNRKNIFNSKRFQTKSTLKKMPWAIIPFILCLFVLVEAIELTGLTQEIGNFFRSVSSDSKTLYTFLFGYLSAISANFLNNIPMSVAFVPIINGASLNGLQPAIFATIIGSNLGANITPLGALAGIMWLSILKNKDYNFKFRDFIKYGIIVTPLCLFICLGILNLEVLLF